MASEVRSGPSNFSYTNNKTENVRVVINYMTSLVSTRPFRPSGLSPGNITTYTLELSWPGATVSANSETDPRETTDFAGNYKGGGPVTIGRNLAGFVAATSSAFGFLIIDVDRTISIASNNCVTSSAQNHVIAFPTEIMLAPKDTITAKCGQYNVVIIPENG